VQQEVETLLAEHNQGAKIIPQNPLSPMSKLLSQAGVEGPGDYDVDLDLGRSGISSRILADSDSGSGTGSSHDFVDPGRFTAGTVVAGRYRIIELLGRGGMGEVYRADDIKLGQTVALKFLPRLFSQDTKWMERFHNEVRIARQVSHPNVCRVFDIGEVDGEQFISMEYIDGENLASLLRRIGRIPQDKALQIARQLCAGLSAAHDKGVLHRDLKPANVMIDGRGQVRITDFGLAAPIDQIKAQQLRAGTPAYMSPEQLAGKNVTIRSDVYSLGLVLYEMFTGKPAFKADSLREYIRLHTEENPDPPSQVVFDLHPDVERVVLRCLEKDPRNRPSSVFAVAAALGGGNMLKEILASGDTPSPEAVAAAGEEVTGARPALALGLLAFALVTLIIVVLLSPRAFLMQLAVKDAQSNPSVLSVRARDTLRNLGYSQKMRDGDSGFGLNAQFYSWVQSRQFGPERWTLLTRPRAGLVYFWYRESPDLMVASRSSAFGEEYDPPLMRPGMTSVRLDPRGVLQRLHVVPDRVIGANADVQPAGESSATAATQSALEKVPVDWLPLLKAAEIDLTRFHPVPPGRFPPIYADTLAAWEGVFPEAPNELIRIEAAALQGKPVYFNILGAWKDMETSGQQAAIQSLGRTNLIVQTLVIIALLVAGSFLAWRNYQTGRGDRSGATRMAIAFFVFGFATWLFRAHHVPDLLMEFILFSGAMGDILFPVALIWIFYLALEPYVRRAWPETIISWSRLLSGKWTDSLVGRDTLIGATVGIASMIITQLEHLAPRWLNMSAPLPSYASAFTSLQSASNFSTLFAAGLSALYLGLILLLFLIIVRIVSRRKWVAGVAFILVFIAATARWTPDAYFSWAAQILIGSLFLFLVIRHGLVAIIACILCRMILWDFPITPDFNVWYANASIIAIASVLTLLGCSFYTSLGGKPLFSFRDLETR